MKLDRRRFLSRSALALGAVAAGEAVAASTADAPPRRRRRTGSPSASPFDGPHQAGVLDRAARRGRARRAGRDRARPRRGSGQALSALSDRARELTQGTTMRDRRARRAAAGLRARSGTEIAPDALTVTVGFGHSLFDDRYGLHRAAEARRG